MYLIYKHIHPSTYSAVFSVVRNVGHTHRLFVELSLSLICFVLFEYFYYYFQNNKLVVMSYIVSLSSRQ